MIQSTFDNQKKVEKYILLSILLSLCFFIKYQFDNDSFWILNSGKYVLENGIPYTEPFTLHNNLDFVMQQWLSASIFALVFEYFGAIGLYVLLILLFMCLVTILYNFCILISDGNLLISFVSVVLSIPLLTYFMILRPYPFSLLIIATTLLIIELYARNKSTKLIYLLPLLSVALINFHAAMWPMFFILFLPYIAEYLINKITKYQSNQYSIKKLLFVAIVSAIAGFINPYAMDAMTYLYHSYGVPEISSYVLEMKPLAIMTLPGLIFFFITILLLLSSGVTLRTRGNLRYLFFIMGTALLAISSTRNLSLFCVLAIPMLAYNFRSIYPKNLNLGNNLSRQKILIVVYFVFIIGISSFQIVNSSDYKDLEIPEQAVNFILKEIDTEELRLYADYNTGGYIEYRGLKPFIDARAEVFLKANNHKRDIFADYVNLQNGRLHYQAFINEYNLNCLLLQHGDLLLTYLSSDPDYKKVYQDNEFSVFILK